MRGKSQSYSVRISCLFTVTADLNDTFSLEHKIPFQRSGLYCFLKNLIKIQYTYHITHPFKVYN